jgi:tetratricopeptide (TPR) repeat protein
MSDGMLLKIIFRQIIRWRTFYFYSIGMILLLSCASSKYKRIKDLHDNQDYQQIAQSQIDCSDYSTSCFQIKLLQADSHYQLGNLEEALKYTQEALDRQEKVSDVKSLNQLHLLRTSIIFELLPEMMKAADELQVLNQLETQLKQILERNIGSTNDSLLKSQRQELLLWLGETFLTEMDLSEGENLGLIFQEIKDLTPRFPANLQQAGYEKYFLLQGELKSLLPQIRTWMSSGNAKGGREQLLEKLKSIYLEGITLRRLPLYEASYGEKIDLFLSQLDQYMKGLVL